MGTAVRENRFTHIRDERFGKRVFAELDEGFL